VIISDLYPDNFEIDAQILAHYIRISRELPYSQLSLTTVGILSDCDCSQTSFHRYW